MNNRREVSHSNLCFKLICCDAAKPSSFGYDGLQASNNDCWDDAVEDSSVWSILAL